MKRKLLLPAMLMIVSVFLLMCGDSSSDDGSSRYYLGTQSRGDVWTWTIDTTSRTGTFSATNEEDGYDYSGTVETLASGYLELTVTSSTEPGFTAPSTAYALEFPNTVLIVAPEDGHGVIVCVAAGTCPAGDETYNWVKTSENTFVPASDEVYGVAESALSESDITFDNTQYKLDGSTHSSSVEAGFSCSDGRITNASDPTDPLVLVMTPSGAFIGDNGYGHGGLIGMKAPASDVSISDLCAIGREFRFVIFEPELSAGDTKPMWGRTDPSHPDQIICGEYEDPFEDSVEKTDASEVSFGTQDDPGIINSTVFDPYSATTRDVVFMINVINGRYFLYGAYDTGDGYLGNFLGIEMPDL